MLLRNAPGKISLFRGVCGESYASVWHTSANKAYEIIRLIFYKREIQNEDEVEVLRGFTHVPCKFTLSQTAGEEVPPIQIPKWDMVLALSKLGMRQVEFDSSNGNLQGISRGLEFAVSPIAFNRWKTNFHEWGHIVLGHTMPSSHEEDVYHRGLMEAEAEILAMLCMKGAGQLDEEAAAHSRGSIKHWLSDERPSEHSIRHVFRAAKAILRAGRVAPYSAPQTGDM